MKKRNWIVVNEAGLAPKHEPIAACSGNRYQPLGYSSVMGIANLYSRLTVAIAVAWGCRKLFGGNWRPREVT